MKTAPLVSVLMPVYNGEKYLEEAIESILRQTYVNWELIICNDASTDNSIEIIQRYKDRRISYIENIENKGIVFTRNRLFTLANGKYLSIMDCDDVALPEKIRLQVDVMEKNSEIGICGTWARQVNEKCDVIGYIQMPSKDVYIRINLLFQSSFVQSSVIIRKDVLEGLSYDDSFPVAEDYDLWEKISHRTNMYNLPKYLLLYRWHEQNISQRTNDLMEAKRTEIISRQLIIFNSSLRNPDKNQDKKETEQPIKEYCFSEQNLEKHKLIGNLTYNKAEPFLLALKEAGEWYSTLIQVNKQKRCFQPIAFHTFIWYRWFFYCFYHKRYFQACCPPFFTLNPAIIARVVGLSSHKLQSVIIKKI